MPSAGPRPPHQDDLLLHHLRTFLGIIDAQAIDAVRGRVRWMQLAGGETLMRQGEPGDALYLLVSGRLRVYIEEDGVRRVVREVSRGEVVGEMSLITDAPRSATLVAIRDSVLVSLGKDDFANLQSHSPQVTLALTRQIIARLRTEHDRTVMDRPVTMALLPVSAGIDSAAFAQSLARELSAHGKVGVLDAAGVDAQLKALGLPSMAVDDERAQRGVAMLFDEFEGTHDYVLLVGDGAPTDWTHRCTRHADEILLLAAAEAEPVVHTSEQAFLVDRPPHAEAAEILVLMHDAGTAMPRGTSRWLARRPVNDHVHLRRGHEGDMARLARIQSRNAVGLVLAGGGARGFAHLGVFRALREHGIEPDYVGGTSIGAIMAALIATDQSPQRLEATARAEFGRNPTGDFSLLPLISLIKGRRLRRIVSRAVADNIGEGAAIEDLWKRFFCVATNFSRASEMVLQRGDLLKSLLASTAIPGALPPVIMDGELLCDGGTFNNFPVDVMRGLRGVGKVIGVDLNASKPRRIELDEMPSGWAMLLDRLRSRKTRRYRLPSLPVLLINSTILYSLSRQRQARALTDLYFNPPLDRVGMLDWKRFDQVVRQGYEHALQVLGDRVPAPPSAARPEMVPGSTPVHQER
ncbi:patatin-like phospholipase family protein [Rhizobacter sp. AJA081-3]|uniref:patatin-like phospholipase family protein n=1 Tax=Rhizobacter sp. AJA081-3 TaxID=2753607 RepID=UPI001AE0DC35|nr:patatin-like phospholipase family protein [Rhizobacter sp. AJA081-3]QTN24745.1 patatin-like phospholipase family protein [Rhizobacter sp. AJA081-3]